jgi:polysaccharide export outer membrane protein
VPAANPSEGTTNTTFNESLGGKIMSPRTRTAFLFTLISLVLLSITVFWSPCSAQEKPYIIGSGDILSVTIFAGPKTTEAPDLVVLSGGTINFPFLGPVKAEGLSVSELTEKVTTPLVRDYFVNPQVIIQVKEYRSKKVYITGAVEKPGLYPLESGATTLIELIARAGGVTEERSNYAHILRESIQALDDGKEIEELVKQKKSIQVNLRELLDKGTSGRNLELCAGDVVYITPASFSDVTQHKIYVLGKVEKPGIYDFQDGLTALDACILAGGFAKYAAPNRATVTRRENGEEEIIKINLNKVRKGQKEDMVLQPGDRLYVPKSWI